MKIIRSKCYICGCDSEFSISDDAVLLREARCPHCGASLRNSDVAKCILDYFGNSDSNLLSLSKEEIAKYKILNTCSSGVIHDALKKSDNYICSEYFKDVPIGEYRDGIMSVDLTNIPFDDDSIDLIISEDVFEHVENYEGALEEINRVLNIGGAHIFTVPLHEGKKTVSRIGKKEVYHGDPNPENKDNGVLVYTDWGDDICDIIDRKGFSSSIEYLHSFYNPDEITDSDSSYKEYLNKRNCLEKYFKYNSNVIVSKVIKNESVRNNHEGDKDLEFTGERFIPGIDDAELEIEHYQRYYSVLPLVKGKVVVDAACGEGYGTNIISEYAKEVIGIDISEEAVAHARKKYGAKSNISFLQESIAELSLKDGSVDIFVSFETLEHIPEELQRQFMKQVQRVLKPNGILIISTPNKKVYSDDRNYHNKYHVHEFYREEFETFISEFFANYRIYHQFFEVMSVIDSDESTDDSIQYKKNDSYEIDGKYYIAIASKGKLPNEKYGSVFLNEYKEYDQKQKRILTLQEEEDTRNKHIIKLDEEIEVYRNRIDELEKWINQKVDLAGKELLDDNQRLSNHSISMKKQIVDLISDKDELVNELEKISDEIAALKQTIKNKEGHIEQLLEVERAYERDKASRSYKIALGIRKISHFFLPENSKRRFFAKVIVRCLKHPSFIFVALNPKRIRTFYNSVKNEGMEGVNLRYKCVEQDADHQSSNIDNSSLDLFPVDKNGKGKTIDKYSKLDFAVHDAPEVSIVIPVYNQFGYTYNCLKAIQKHSGDVAYEIIIADDCSTDATEHIKDAVSGITVVRNKENLRFLLNCNNAAKHAKGKYILFLNNDTQVQKNWLRPLVDLMSDSTIGMVGSKLVYADGRLQEAGGILWKDGSAWNYGNKKNPEDPEYNYVKEVDYISGAAIMIRKSLWEEIGGFDEQFAPAYCEDSDLAFEVRKHGYKVVYQPLSVVVHFEGVSNGTDLSCGQKAYQVANSKKFYEKWKNVLEKENFDNAENVFIAKDRSRFKKHILVVDQYVPMYDKDAGCKTSYMYLKMFLKMGFQVTFIGDNFFKHEPYTTELNQLGIEVLYGNYYGKNWKAFLKENLKYFDYVYLQRPHIASKYIDIVKEYGNAKIIYYAHDLHHVREKREYELTGDRNKLESSEKWKKIEYDLFTKADVGQVVGKYEQEIMQKAFPNKPIRSIPIFIYDTIPQNVRKDFSQRQDLMYVGGFGHPPNVDCVLWFSKEVMPLIVEKYPDIKWHIVGSKATDEVKALASKNIIVDGFLSDEELAEMYNSCRIDIAPLRFGAGVKGKVVEAAYYQIPLVTTSIGAEGLDDSVGNMYVVDDAKEMADYICDLYENYDALREMSDAGKVFIEKYLTPKSAEDILRLDMDV